MQVIIHRGTKQIGGSCVEVWSGDYRILLDLGLPLAPVGEGQDIRGLTIEELLESGTLPRIGGAYANDTPGVRAVIVSHVHQDHTGLAQYVHPEIPVYATEGTWALHDALRPFLPRSVSIANRQTLPKNKPCSFGSLIVTAIPVDHSAPDAVALLVEAEGKRLLYSGDLRAHGRKDYLFNGLAKKLAGKVDLLLLEGTTLGRTESAAVTEKSLEIDLVSLFKQQQYFSLVFCSTQNLDRLVTIYRAAKQTNKLMVIDPYTAYTLDKLQCISDNLPQWNWAEIKVVPWAYQMQRLKDAGETEFVAALKTNQIGWDRMKARGRDIVLLMRSNKKAAFDLRRRLGDGLRDVQVIWSMWNGYWDKDENLRPLCDEYGIKRHYIHTSGHASWTDL